MYGALISGALQLGSSIFGGMSSAAAMRKQQNSIEQEKRENQSWYDRNKYEDATQRADAQRILTITRDAIRSRNKAIAGSQAVAGGTEEAVAAEKARNNAMMADATSRIATAAEARKDNIESAYMQNKANYNQQLNNLEAQKAQAITKAIEGVGNVAGNIVGSYSDTDLFKKKDNGNTEQ